MCTGQLKKFLRWIDRILFTEIYAVDIYYWFISFFLKPKIEVKRTRLINNKIKFNAWVPEVPDIDVKSFDLPQGGPVFVRDLNLNVNAVITDYPYKVGFCSVRKLFIEDILIKINKPVLNVISVVRSYTLGFYPRIRKPDASELIFQANVKEIAEKDVHLEKKLRVTEEILEICPYDRSVPVKKLIGLPVVRKPSAKSYFSLEEMEKFRKALAHHNNTKFYNVIIKNIYDRFYPEMYSSVSLRAQGNALLCFLKPESHLAKPKSAYYYIIGERKDTGAPIQALVLM